MDWYLVYTKPRQERIAVQNLERQGFHCYLPTYSAETLRRGVVCVNVAPLFPRYLFVQKAQSDAEINWLSVRSTRGVSRLVTFGSVPAKIDKHVIAYLQARETALIGQPVRLFEAGEHVQVTEGPFRDLDGVYQVKDGEQRAMILLEVLSKPVVLQISLSGLRKYPM